MTEIEAYQKEIARLGETLGRIQEIVNQWEQREPLNTSLVKMCEEIREASDR